jgi:integrase
MRELQSPPQRTTKMKAMRFIALHKLWYGAGVPGQGKKRFPLATDKNVAKKMLADLVEKSERGIAHMPDKEEAGQALEPLVVEFEATIGRKAGQQHTKMVILDVRRVLAGCKLTTLAHLRSKDLTTRVEAFVWSRMEGKDGVGPATAAYAGKHARSFTRWLWQKRKLLDFDPLAGMDIPSQETQNPRRALSPEEIETLIKTTEGSAHSFRYLTGPERALIYLVAVATGYRAGELAKLTPAHFDLNADVPVARLKGKDTKNKKPAEQPIPPTVVARLQKHLKGRPVDKPVWPGTWSKRSAIMFKEDMAAAGIPLVVDGEEALFHSLRHSCTSLLARSATVKVTQELSRHSTPILTLGRYSHTTLKEKADAVAGLPLPGTVPAGGPFAQLTRSELEATAEALLTSVLAALSLTPRLTPNSGTVGDFPGQMGTNGQQSEVA